MKVGTISVNINTPDFNYGAMLHSWAFQQYLMKLDFVEKVEIIDYITPYLEKENWLFPPMNIFVKGRWKSARYHTFYYPRYLKRLLKFRKFTKNQMITTDRQYTQKTLNSAKLPYDAIVCESDVIWSSGLTRNKFDKSFFAALDSMKNMNRIAYSPSMGDAVLREEEKREFKELIKNLDYISCRETYAKPVIEEFTDKEVTHVLDPVLLLEPEDYEQIIGTRLCKEHYLLLYLPVDNNKKLRRAAEQYADEHNLKIIEISTKLRKSLSPKIKTLTTAGVEEFLSGIKYADIVFTNSFHAICFSVIFKTQFYAFSRRYAGKVKDICEVMGVPERYFSDDNFKEQTDINFSEVYRKWGITKSISQEWIKKSLQGG